MVEGSTSWLEVGLPNVTLGFVALSSLYYMYNLIKMMISFEVWIKLFSIAMDITHVCTNSLTNWDVMNFYNQPSLNNNNNNIKKTLYFFLFYYSGVNV